MSDTSQGEGWWQATDGKWYPPEAATAPTTQQPSVEANPTSQMPVTPPGAAVPGTPYAESDGTLDPDAEKPAGKGKLIAALLVLALLVGAAVAFFALTGDDDEASTVDVSTDTTEAPDIGDATGTLVDDGPIEFNTTYDDSLSGTRTEARYTLDAPDGAIMTLKVANDAASTSGIYATFESSGERFAAFRTAPGATEEQIVILAHDGGAPFDLVFTEGPAEYKFSVALEIADDAGEGGDAGDDFDTAFAIDDGQEVAGSLGGQDQTDVFTLDITPGTDLTLDMAVDRSSERAAFVTVELEGDRLFAERVQPGADSALSMLLSDQDEGTLEIIVTEGPANYTFTAAFGTQNEGGSEGDAPGELASARSVDIASPITGQIGDRDTADYYTFDAAAGTLTVTASADASNAGAFAVTFEDAAGQRIGFVRVNPGAELGETVELEAAGAVRMIVTEGRGAYSVTIA